MRQRSYDAIIVGAGIVGAACAHELAVSGQRVAVFEAGTTVGAGATAAGMGHLAVMDDSEAQFALTSYSQRLWRELSAQLPADAEYLPCGSLWVAADEEESAEVERKYRFYSQRQIPVEILDSRQLAEAEPLLRPGMAGGLLMSADSVCYPPCAARFLMNQVQQKGGTLFLCKPIARVESSAVIDESGDRYEAAAIIVATGTAITQLFPEIPVLPRKGHLLITDRYPGFLHHQLIELGYLKSAHSTGSDSVAFNAQPRQTGQILLGSSRQYGTQSPAIESEMLRRMLARATEYMPALVQFSAIRAWTGFRAATPDKLPLIGRYPKLENVFLATGHEGLGISTSTATARLLADEIMNRPSEIPRAPYCPGRSFVTHA